MKNSQNAREVEILEPGRKQVCPAAASRKTAKCCDATDRMAPLIGLQSSELDVVTEGDDRGESPQRRESNTVQQV